MQLIQTKLDDSLVTKIKESGLSSYRFLQEAVEEKLERDKLFEEQNEKMEKVFSTMQNIFLDGIAQQNKLFEEKFMELMEFNQAIKKIIDEDNEEVKNSVLITNNKADEMREKTNLILNKIFDKLGVK